MTSLNQRHWWGPRPPLNGHFMAKVNQTKGGWEVRGSYVLNCFLNTSLGQSHTLRFDCLNQDTTWPDRLHYPEWPGEEVKEVRLVDSRKSKTAVRALFSQMPWLVAYGNFFFYLQVHLWFASTGLKEFKSSYGNHKNATSFVPLFEKNDGGARSVRFCPGGVMHRGLCINVKHLPSGLVRRLFSLVCFVKKCEKISRVVFLACPRGYLAIADGFW